MEARIRRVRNRVVGVVEEAPKRCPFCGGVPEIHKHFMDKTWSMIHKCKVVGYIEFSWTPDKPALIRRWNTRYEG